MNSAMLFALATVGALLAAMLFYIGNPKKVVDHLKGDLGILKGIVIFLGAGLVVALVSSKCEAKEHNWLTYGDIYMGIDHTKNVSPQCVLDGVSDRATSNGGVVLNIYRSEDKRFHWNTKYTHHSCAFNADSASYDALGFEFKYRGFER